MNNEGYFRSVASGELIEKNRTAKASYTINLQPRYRIKGIEFVKNDSSIFAKSLFNVQKNSLLKTGNPYQFSTIEAERERIEQALKKQGFYYFRPDYIIIKADTNLLSQQVSLYVELKPNTTQLALKKYTIHQIYVISENGLLKSDTLAGAIRRRGLNIVDASKAYRTRVFADAIGFQPNILYSSEIQDVSLSRLINLKNFKFVKNRFELLPRSDSALLDVYYYLTPLKPKSLRAELSAVTKSNNLAGSQLNLTWQHRNAFRGAEMLRFTANAGIDFQLGGKKRSDNLRDYYRTSVEGELSFPRFVLPFYRMNPAKNQTLPKSTLTAGYEQLSQKDFYTQTSIRLNWGYVWRRNTQVEHSFTPIALNVVRPRNISEALVDSISSPFLQIQDLLRYFNILENRLILGAQYTISYTPTPPLLSKHRFVLNAGIDIAGNTAGLFAKKEDGVGIVLGIPYEQYARFDADIRYYHDISPHLRWANRFIGGLGIPYGNSFSLPQFKQYFAGGSNGIRAFRGRALGPGSATPDPKSIFGFAAFGDVRLELNTELRYKINDYFETALFTDMGK
ncbi:MAG: BamA/TamA family outer membrane protein [Spirosomataceae bacterium]